MTPKRSFELPDYAVSDEAAAYIADILMEIALQFEAAHFPQARRHHASLRPEPAAHPSQPPAPKPDVTTPPTGPNQTTILASSSSCSTNAHRSEYQGGGPIERALLL